MNRVPFFSSSAIRLAFAAALSLFACAAASADITSESDNVEFFEKQVRPLLVEQCLGCHGAPAAIQC